MDTITARSALVTGSTQGIGRAIAERLAQDNKIVGINGRGSERVKGVVEEFRARGWRAFEAPGDVTDSDGVGRVLAQAVEATGAIDILVNNCGGTGGIETPLEFERFSEEDWHKIIDLNLTSAFLCSRAVVPQMKARGWGRIVNISSESGRTPVVPRFAGWAYAAAKTGLFGLSRVLAAELAPFGITVNVVAPGFTRSGPVLEAAYNALPEERRRDRVRGIKLGRWAEPAEIAGAVAYLASDEASYVVGAVLDVNGGSFMP